MKILAEGLDKYPVDGLFFNMFSNQSTDYSGRYVGLCHCDAYQRKYRSLHGKPVPDKPDEDYRRFSLPAHAGLIRDLLHRLHPRRQIRTNAHPLVEMSLMHQGTRTLLHLINLSGPSQTGYFDPVPMSDIRIQVTGRFRQSRTNNQAIPKSPFLASWTTN